MIFLAIGFIAGILAQAMNFPMTYGDYREAVYDRQKLRQFYKDAAVDFFLNELIFMVLSLLLGLGLEKLFSIA